MNGLKFKTHCPRNEQWVYYLTIFTIMEVANYVGESRLSLIQP